MTRGDRFGIIDAGVARESREWKQRGEFVQDYSIDKLITDADSE